ncbi:hypothetical protein [Ruegeria sp. HKCCSP351]|uniref:hypothetical protein n=1 Tax=Ruegeria sp. HKCCSP351 TaxID=2794832 RepID=UPI001AEA67B4|nr:hypothetical protein [Ruegeria sp. HKCCSP351]
MTERFANSLVPLSILAFLVLTDFLAWLGYIPNKLEAFSFLASWLAENGLVFVFFLAIIENAAVLNVYFPGSIAILTAMAGAVGSLHRILSVWFVVTLGSLVGLSLTFLVAKAVLKSKRRSSGDVGQAVFLEKHWIITALTSFWHPHVASLTCILLAQKSASFWNFLRIAAFGNMFWNSFWTVIVLTVGNVFSEGLAGLVLVYSYLIVWLIYSLFKAR